MAAERPAGAAAAPGAIAFVFVVALLDMLAFGIVVPILPYLLVELTGSAAHASAWVGLSSALFAAAQFVAMPIQGALSDRFGRRPVLLASSAGLCLLFVLFATSTSLVVLMIARVLSGATSANLGTVNAYVADVTSEANRAKAMGIVGGAFGIGLILGPALGSLLSGIDLHLPFWLATGLCAANVAYGLFVLPESLPPERRVGRLTLTDATPLHALALLRGRPALTPLVTAFLLLGLAQTALVTLFVLYAFTELGWSVQGVGFGLMWFGLLNGVVQIGLTAPATAMLGERGAVHAGLWLGAIGFALLATAPGSWLIAVIPLLAASFLAEGPLQALMTAQVDHAAQGRFQGALEAGASLAAIVGPLVFSALFAWGLAGWGGIATPGLPFLAGALLLLIGSAVIAAVRPRPAPPIEENLS